VVRRTALLLAWLAVVAPLQAAEEAEGTRETVSAASENPILSLLLLPANLLARIASMLPTPTPRETQRDPREPDQNANRRPRD